MASAPAAFGDRGLYRMVNTTRPSEVTDFTRKQGLGLANALMLSIAVDPPAPGTIYGIAFDQLAGMVTSRSGTTSFISTLAIAPSDPQVVYVGTSEGALYLTSDRETWRATGGLPLPAGGFVTRIRVDPASPARVLVAVQGVTGPGRVWLSITAGARWTDLTGNLPPGLQVYSLAADWRFADPDLYLGTDRGVFRSQRNKPKWQPFGHGLPSTLVSDLHITPPALMTAATYGRGVFQVELPKAR
jgi:hypothetical protein